MVGLLLVGLVAYRELPVSALPIDDLQTLVPRKHWALFSHLLIWHGRRRCYARNPDCPHCELLPLCPFGQKRLKQSRMGA